LTSHGSLLGNVSIRSSLLQLHVYSIVKERENLRSLKTE
jgi:hypothetical protein